MWSRAAALKPSITALALFCTIPAASADMPQLAGETLRTAVSGTTVHLDTPLGTKLPLSFGADGRVSGTAGPLLAAYLGAANDRGRWWVENEKLCSKWLKWFDTDTSCMQIWRDGNRVRWLRDDGRSGTAMIVTDPEPTRSALGGPIPTEPVATGPQTAATAPGAMPAPSATAAPVPSRQVAAPPAARPAAKKVAAGARPSVSDTVVRLRPLIPPQPPRAAATEPPPPATVAEPQGVPPAAVTTAPDAPAPLTTAQQPAPTSRMPPPRAEAPGPVAPYPVAYRVANVMSDDVLNVRRRPSSDAEVAGEIPPHGRGIRLAGDCVAMWCQIRYGRISGWVNRFYLAADRTMAERR